VCSLVSSQQVAAEAFECFPRFLVLQFAKFVFENAFNFRQILVPGRHVPSDDLVQVSARISAGASAVIRDDGFSACPGALKAP
jgi:hypothetical protein